MKKFLEEFKAFAVKGNVMDLAIGVIIGGAFGSITTSLINDVIMPIIGLILGQVDFSSLAITVGDASIAYGAFIQAVFNFFMIAFVTFWLMKAMNKFKKKEEAKHAAPPEPSDEVKLLTEIRDELKKR